MTPDPNISTILRTFNFMSQTPAADNFEDKMKKVFMNPTVQNAVVDAIVTNRPAGWGRRSIAPYFKEKYGLEMKKVIDDMMQDGQPVLFEYEEFQRKFGQSPETLYLRINQSLRYLMEKLDDSDKTYGRFVERLHVFKKRRVGIIMELAPTLTGDTKFDLTPKKIEPTTSEPKWKEELQQYLETAQPGAAPFLREKLCLNPEEIQQVKDSLAPLGNSVLHSVTSYSIKVIRVNGDEV